jgi:hypothetical protein
VPIPPRGGGRAPGLHRTEHLLQIPDTSAGGVGRDRDGQRRVLITDRIAVEARRSHGTDDEVAVAQGWAMISSGSLADPIRTAAWGA